MESVDLVPWCVAVRLFSALVIVRVRSLVRLLALPVGHCLAVSASLSWLPPPHGLQASFEVPFQLPLAVPAKHGIQDGAPSGAQVPGGQSLHAVVFTPDALPGGQAVHVKDAAELTVPGLHRHVPP